MFAVETYSDKSTRPNQAVSELAAYRSFNSSNGQASQAPNRRLQKCLRVLHRLDRTAPTAVQDGVRGKHFPTSRLFTGMIWPQCRLGFHIGRNSEWFDNRPTGPMTQDLISLSSRLSTVLPFLTFTSLVYRLDA